MEGRFGRLDVRAYTLIVFTLRTFVRKLLHAIFCHFNNTVHAVPSSRPRQTGQTLSLGCHIAMFTTVPSIRVSSVSVMVSVRDIALNKYRCKYGYINSMFAYQYHLLVYCGITTISAIHGGGAIRPWPTSWF